MEFTKNNTCVSLNRLANLMTYIFYTRELEGDICEFGVCQGGSLNFIRMVNPNPNKKIYGVDSFEGLPLSEDYEHHKQGEMKADYNKVSEHFNQFDNVILFKGFSPKVFLNFPKDVKFSFCHIDVDLYSSVTDACNFFYPRLVPNGVIIFDDYNWASTTGATKAIDEYFAKINAKCKKELFWAWHNIKGENTTHFQYLVVK